MSLSRLCTYIKSGNNLTQDSLQSFLQSHFKQEDVTVVEFGPIRNLGGLNDGLQSEIKKVAVKCKLGLEEEEEEMHFVIKLPVTSFLKYFHKVTRPFAHEVLWFTRSVPAAESLLLQNMVPKCIHGHVEEEKGATECNTLLTAFAFKRCEKGMIILEDITKGREPFYSLDKNLVPSREHVSLAISPRHSPNVSTILLRFVYDFSTIIPCRPCLSRVRKIFLQFFYNFSTILPCVEEFGAS
jgi:hypothetical protein